MKVALCMTVFFLIGWLFTEKIRAGDALCLEGTKIIRCSHVASQYPVPTKELKEGLFIIPSDEIEESGNPCAHLPEGKACGYPEDEAIMAKASEKK